MNFWRTGVITLSDGRVLLLGIDGLDPTLLTRLVDNGCLENFSEITHDGILGYNKVFVPPLSPAIWTSLATGLSPFQHGVLDFIEVVNVNGKMKTVIYSFSVLKEKSIWDYLGLYDYRSIIVNYPLTYPPYPIRGIMVSGFPSPSQDMAVYPSTIENKLKNLVPDYKIEYIPPRELTSISNLRQIVNRAVKSMKRRVRLWKYLVKTYEWNFTSLILTEIDRVQHIMFGCDFCYEPLIKLYENLDRLIGEILDTIEDHHADTIIVSDHGFEKVEKYISLPAIMESLRVPYNSSTVFGMLKSKGIQKIVLLVTKTNFMQSLINFLVKMNLFSMLDKVFNPSIGQVIIQNNFSLKLLNKDRKIVTLLKNALLKIKDPKTRQNVFDRVFTRKEYVDYILNELLPQKDLDSEDIVNTLASFPDLVVVPKSGYEPTINRLPELITPINKGGRITKTGAHCSTRTSRGVFIAYGPRVKKQTHKRYVEVGVLDIAPTILALYNIGQPVNMYGRVLNDIFNIKGQTRLMSRLVLKDKIDRLFGKLSMLKRKK